MRGKGLLGFGPLGRRRITPAHAGKSAGLAVSLAGRLGSPPRMRGKVADKEV